MVDSSSEEVPVIFLAEEVLGIVLAEEVLVVGLAEEVLGYCVTPWPDIQV
jgi:hypothetical protein